MKACLLAIAIHLCFIIPAFAGTGKLPAQLAKALDPSDAILVTDGSQHVIFSQNAKALYVPASTLKVATALFALETLGESYRFPTDVTLSQENILHLKGYGDPLLTSEVLDQYAKRVANDLTAGGIYDIDGIAVDALYFDPVTIPGVVLNSHQPYDAPNGALCANFNTVFYTRNNKGIPVSAEPQTPLLPFIARRIPPDVSKGRIRLEPAESRLYAGHLFRWFLEKHGVTVAMNVRAMPFPEKKGLYEKQLLSPYALPETIKQLMAFSNNFIANQLFLASAARVEGEPATLEKGRRAFCDVMTPHLKACPDVVEGSGISRKNKISAETMNRLLDHFSPYADLLHTEGNTRFKTGTLTGVSTRAGYLTTPTGNIYRFVIFTNRKDGNAGTILRALQAALALPSYQ
ncbi:peptidase M15 [Desulfoluna limicola]|uniref:Peptidase M15 n=1 Tax=Desulfoluna limicola TaxID=2810562 RepID=A0ABN6EZT5_9BACT|nr:D-alanyl-D-alanine carboxypeptidase [Desulfoluna limicola]BCS95802.1 peptidase M15 [Desulfoluna limicola]